MAQGTTESSTLVDTDKQWRSIYTGWYFHDYCTNWNSC